MPLDLNVNENRALSLHSLYGTGMMAAQQRGCGNIMNGARHTAPVQCPVPHLTLLTKLPA